jgi:hypothetical protein
VGGRRRTDGPAIPGPGRAPAPTARGVTAGGGPRGPGVAGATATAPRRAPAALQTAPRTAGLATTAAAVEEEAGVGGSGSASAAPAARAATLAASAGEPAAGRLGLEVITRLTAAGARAVGSAVAEGSGHREDAVVAATEEGQSASGGGAVRCATANKHAFLASSCVTL